ncbi:MAG: uroporphyrinogen-III synthase [Muribaculaceae bacterium]|nr:uroporphyrinogen-III synthase [Muribaculaceae bacterium]
MKRILVSQPKPQTEKSPYFDLEKKYDIEIIFRPFIKVEGLTAKEFRQQRLMIPDYTAIIFTARTAIDHFFRLCKETRYTVPDTQKYFCVSEAVANYLQKYIIYRKRKIFFAESGKLEDLVPLIQKHNKETYMMAVSDVHNDQPNALDEHGIQYVKAVMYRTVSNDFAPDEPLDYDMLCFFSPAGVKSLMTNFPDFKQDKIAIAAMGNSTIEAVKEAGLKLNATITPETPSMPAAIEKYLKRKRVPRRKEEKEQD